MQGAAVNPNACCLKLIVLSLSLTLLAHAKGQEESIHGRVTDPDGTPIIFARVGVIDSNSAQMREIQTDHNGLFRIDGLVRNRRYWVAVTKYGYGTETRDVFPGSFDFVLKPETPAPEPRNQTASVPPTFAVAVSQVLLNVSVRDPNGTAITGLKRGDFTVLEDGSPQTIIDFEEEESPLSVVLLLDISSSMQGVQLDRAKQAAGEFLEQMGAANEIALMAFNERVRTIHPFTLDRTKLRASIDQLSAGGGTALYDALAAAIRVTRDARFRRHFIVLFSDGMDTDSASKFENVQNLVEASDVVLYALGEYSEPERKLFINGSRYFKDPPLDSNYNPVWVLRHLTELSGGVPLFPTAAESLGHFFSRIATDLRHEYFLAYTPESPARAGFHHIEVRVAAPSSQGALIVRTRKGYVTAAARKEQSSENR